ncbi:MAG: hypothetical protein R3F62_28065 [Planctomycetota bacterium]
MEHLEFVERVVPHLPSSPPPSMTFKNWDFGGRPTKEGLGVLAVPGLDPQKLVDAVMDVDHYVGNIDKVVESRAIADPRFSPPESVRFYQRVKLPVLGSIHYENVLHRIGTRAGYEVVAWHLLEPETSALSAKVGMRNAYSLGAWFAAPGVVAYALATAPRREDVGLIKWKAMTRGADAAASTALKINMDGMARWAARRA